MVGGQYSILYMLLLSKLLLSFMFVLFSFYSMVGFIFFMFCQLVPVMSLDLKYVDNTLLSDHLSVDLNHKYGEILSTYEDIISEYQITNIERSRKLGQEMEVVHIYQK